MRKLTKSVRYFTTRNPTIRRGTTKRTCNGKSGKDQENKSDKKTRFDESENIRIKLETKIFNGMRMEEADMNIRFIAYLALGSMGKCIFEQMIPKVELLRISFANF